MSVVVISTVTFVLGTMPELTDNLDMLLFDNETEVIIGSLLLTFLNGSKILDRESESLGDYSHPHSPKTSSRKVGGGKNKT